MFKAKVTFYEKGAEKVLLDEPFLDRQSAIFAVHPYLCLNEGALGVLSCESTEWLLCVRNGTLVTLEHQRTEPPPPA